MLNAKSFFNNGLYYETFRPPLMALIVGLIAQITGYLAAEIIYIILINLLFTISVVLVSKQLNIDKELFYLSIITPYFLFFALLMGTELLFITFLLFGIYFILRDNWISGLFIGLSALSRYSAIVFGIFLLFHKNIKNIVKSVILFCLTFVPWFIYSRIKYGNFFTSIADQFHQNIISRLDLVQAPKLMHFVTIQSLFFIFTFLGIAFSLFYILKKKKQKTKKGKVSKKESKKKNLFNLSSLTLNKKFTIIIFVLLIYTIYSYLTTPFKDVRYLFALVLPIGYFTYVGIELIINNFIKNKKRFKIIMSALMIIIIILSGITILVQKAGRDREFKNDILDGVELVKENNLEDCVMYSDSWIFFSYIDEDVIALPIEIYDNTAHEHGDKVLFLYRKKLSEELENKLKSYYDVVAEKDSFIVLGDLENCKTKEEYNDIFYTYNAIYTNPCNILFNKIKFVEDICHFVNFSNN